MFILMYVVSYVGGANLLRHAEGATWLAIVTVKRLTLNSPSLRGINILKIALFVHLIHIIGIKTYLFENFSQKKASRKF